MSIIHIYSATIQKDREKTSLLYEIGTTDENKETLYYTVDKEYGNYLTPELADPVLVTILPYAMKGGYDIVSDIPVSEVLYHNLTAQFIPQMCVCNPGKYHKVSISADTVVYDFHPTAVASGMSCGVDSFTTLKEYTVDCSIESLKLTHLTFFENGAHHLGYSGYHEQMQAAYNKQLENTKRFCEEYGYRLVSVSSNVNYILSQMFWDEAYQKVHTYRNIGFVLSLQKLFRVYCLSPGVNLDEFTISLECASGHYEPFLLPCISTNNTRIFDSNKAMSRIEKTEYLADFDQTYNHLTVCFKDFPNCGRCEKCRRTLLTLDFLGKLDLYKNTFDIDYYRSNRNWYLTRLCMGRRHDKFLQDIYELAKSKNIKIPLSCKIKGGVLHIVRAACIKLLYISRSAKLDSKVDEFIRTKWSRSDK